MNVTLTYHNARVGFVVVRRMHALKSLLTSGVPEIWQIKYSYYKNC